MATEKRVCLLTGASGTLGSAFCRSQAADYAIAALYRRNLPPVASQRQWMVDPLRPGDDLGENHHPVFAVQADLSRDEEIDRAVEAVLARFGRIDLVVNAAVRYGASPVLDEERFFRLLGEQLRLNTEVPARVAISVARQFWRDRDRENAVLGRSVVNVSSVSGFRCDPRTQMAAYGASKAALNLLTGYLAEEFGAFGVRVNAVAPTAFPRIVPTERVVESIVQLDQSDLTGSIIVCDAEEAGWEQPSRIPAAGSLANGG